MAAEHLFFEGLASRRTAREMRAGEMTPHPVPQAPPGADRFFSRLLGSAGLPTAAYRSRALNRRIPACLRLLGARDLEAAWARIAHQPELATPALSIALLGVTGFFRDRQVFDELKCRLAAWAPRAGNFRIWSAGCSSGQELYSVAILLRELGMLDRCDLLGTDCRPDAIDRAAGALYHPSDFRRLDDRRLPENFEHTLRGLRASRELRLRTRWKRASLLDSAERGPWDLILWRNMAIYLEPPAADRAWRSLAAELAPGGILVTGKAERAPAHPGLRRLAPCIYRKE